MIKFFGRGVTWTGAFAGAVLLLVSLAPAARAELKPQYASIVIDASSGRVISETNADMPHYPASLTKMMTLYLVFQALESGHLHLDQLLPVSDYAASQSPTKLGLEAGDTISVHDLILGLVTRSANDAAVVAAEALGGSETEFAARMTRAARALGMSNTTYRNASGLPDPGQITTARDVATLARALYRDFPNEYRYFGTETFTYKGELIANHNHLMSRFAGMDGIKTGFIRASGFNLAASAVRNNWRIIGVVMGGTSAPSRDEKMALLLNYTFAHRPPAPAFELASTAASPGSSAVQAPGPSQAVAVAPLPDLTPSALDESIAARAAHTFRQLSPVGRAEAATLQAGPGHDLASRTETAKWSIQVGAFNERESAERAAALAMDRLHGRKTRKSVEILAPSETDNISYYRALIVNFGSPREAAHACHLLHAEHRACLMLPPNSPRLASR